MRDWTWLYLLIPVAVCVVAMVAYAFKAQPRAEDIEERRWPET